jgi:simple sugar transport system substrate-binding protein
MSKKVLGVMSIFFVAAMVLTACAPASATTAPAAAPGAATKADWCSGVKIVFFPGGTPGGGFEQVVYNGALQAARIPARMCNTSGRIGTRPR